MSNPNPVEVTVTERDEAGPSVIRVTRTPAWRIILVRSARTYLQTLIGLTAALSVAPLVLPADQAGAFVLLGAGQQFLLAAQLAVAPAIASVLQNTAELLAKIDATAPELRA